MTEKGKLEWVDAGGNELAAGASVAMVGKVVGRHGGGRISVEFSPGQRIIVSGKVCTAFKKAKRQAANPEAGPAEAAVSEGAEAPKGG